MLRWLERLMIRRRGQVTERFTRAIEQLGQRGDYKLRARIGAVYTLEQIARDSAELHWPIMEVLTAHLREHAARWAGVEAGDRGPRPWADHWAIATVLRRRTVSQDAKGRWLDLRGVNLIGADLGKASLRGANLSTANLGRASLHGADLSGANLSGADLGGANLSGANLSGASLSGASLSGANLSGASLSRASLSGANLSGANLSRASLFKANLSGANLSGAVLNTANLVGANLIGADLRRAGGLTQEQLSVAIESFCLPPELP